MNGNDSATKYPKNTVFVWPEGSIYFENTKLGLDNIPECGTNEEVLRAHRMDADNLAIDIENFFNGSDI